MDLPAFSDVEKHFFNISFRKFFTFRFFAGREKAIIYSKLSKKLLLRFEKA